MSLPSDICPIRTKLRSTRYTINYYCCNSLHITYPHRLIFLAFENKKITITAQSTPSWTTFLPELDGFDPRTSPRLIPLRRSIR